MKKSGSPSIFGKLLSVAVVLWFTTRALHAQAPDPGGGNSPYYGTPLQAWWFNDTEHWTSDFGIVPVSFTNLSTTPIGDGSTLLLDTNVPAWLQYNVYETNGATNITVDVGSVMLWFAPSWSGTNEGGFGPGTFGRLIEVGSTNGAGWWSLYVDPNGVNIYLTGQTNGGSPVTYLSAPIDWMTNEWHHIAVTYTTTNTVLYLDGFFATNGPAMTDYPGLDVLTNGFFVGSDSTGDNQAHGAFDRVCTYDYPLDRSIADAEYMTGILYLTLNSYHYSSSIQSAPSTSASVPQFIAVTGPGYLQWQGTDGACATGTNVWIKNTSATNLGNTVNVTFTITGGIAGAWYDVFATPALASPITNAVWSWVGQGTNCGIYTLSLSNSTAFLILGTPLDSDGDGLTDAYERLVSHTDPNIPDTSQDDMLDGWKVMWGMNPLLNNPAQPSLRSNYGYDLADWLNGVSGIKSGSVATDNEGNVTAVSQ